MTFSEQLHQYSDMTRQALEDIMAEQSGHTTLHDAMAYSLFAGGKRIRPAICMASCELYGGRAADALPAACALEMIHTYSLIHDDLPAMDNDPMRRGKPSNHIAFGEANAILAGDGLLSLAFSVLAKAGNIRAVEAVARAAFDMVAGQVLDLNPDATAEELSRIHRLKTGAMVFGAAEAGARMAGAADGDVAVICRFAESYGLLFQITDDILDVVGSREQLGKSVGKDAASDKTTFVTCYGIDGAKDRALEAAQSARAAIQPFGAQAWFFEALVSETLTRTN